MHLGISLVTLPTAAAFFGHFFPTGHDSQHRWAWFVSVKDGELKLLDGEGSCHREL